jgi:transcriptional regulator with XRE-family HTH domain
MPWRIKAAGPSVIAHMAEAKERMAARLHRARAEHGRGGKPLSQEDAAHRVGAKTRQWQRWEAAEHMPQGDALDRIAAEFGFDPSEFYVPEIDTKSQLDRIEETLDDVKDQLEELLSRLPEGEKESNLANLQVDLEKRSLQSGQSSAGSAPTKPDQSSSDPPSDKP